MNQWFKKRSIFTEVESMQKKLKLNFLHQTNRNKSSYVTTDSGPKHLVTTLTRANFEKLADDLVKRSMSPVKKALDDASLSARYRWSKWLEVLLGFL